jgi:hypothetical protein
VVVVVLVVVAAAAVVAMVVVVECKIENDKRHRNLVVRLIVYLHS